MGVRLVSLLLWTTGYGPRRGSWCRGNRIGVQNDLHQAERVIAVESQSMLGIVGELIKDGTGNTQLQFDGRNMMCSIFPPSLCSALRPVSKSRFKLVGESVHRSPPCAALAKPPLLRFAKNQIMGTRPLKCDDAMCSASERTASDPSGFGYVQISLCGRGRAIGDARRRAEEAL